MKWVPIIVMVVCFLIFSPNFVNYIEEPFYMLENGCVIHSLEHKLSQQAKETLEPYIWSKVLAIHFYGKVGHAVNVFHYEKVTYVYDPNLGTYPIYERPIYDPLELAEIIFPKIPIRKAYFLEPTFLLQYQTDSFRIY